MNTPENDVYQDTEAESGQNALQVRGIDRGLL